MKIAIIGAGRIGSTYAFHLAKGGHDVTVIARGPRLATLQHDGAIVSVTDERANVRALDALAPETPFDLVLVTVLAHQVDAVVPSLQASAARSVLFLFNSFETTERLRVAVGATRAEFGFPNMIAFLIDGRLKSTVDGPGMVTTLGSATWAEVLSKAGLPTEVEPDMDAFLRSHVAFVLPMMVAGHLVYERKSPLQWSEAKKLSGALREGLDVVRGLGHPLRPGFMGLLARFPRVTLTFLLWATSRAAMVRDLGAFGPGEARALIDAMTAAAPGRTPQLLAIRP